MEHYLVSKIEHYLVLKKEGNSDTAATWINSEEIVK